MGFPFYPKHEYGCEHVGHCPHLGGAALGSVVLLANQNHETYQAQLRTIDQLREDNAGKFQRIVELEQQVAQLKLELKLERQNKYKKNSSDEDVQTTDEPTPAAEQTSSEELKKRGAPLGHPGWFRPRPESIDQTIEVPAPRRCPLCGGEVRVKRNKFRSTRGPRRARITPSKTRFGHDHGQRGNKSGRLAD